MSKREWWIVERPYKNQWASDERYTARRKEVPNSIHVIEASRLADAEALIAEIEENARLDSMSMHLSKDSLIKSQYAYMENILALIEKWRAK